MRKGYHLSAPAGLRGIGPSDAARIVTRQLLAPRPGEGPLSVPAKAADMPIWLDHRYRTNEGPVQDLYGVVRCRWFGCLLLPAFDRHEQATDRHRTQTGKPCTDRTSLDIGGQDISVALAGAESRGPSSYQAGVVFQRLWTYVCDTASVVTSCPPLY